MAITYTDNGGGAPNGSDLEFTFTFPVIQTEDVKVALNGVTQATTKYAVDTASNPTKITFNNTSVDSSVQESTGAPKSGVRVRVYRETTVGKSTGDDDPKAVFAAGSSIRAVDLNANVEQSLYAIHELQTRPIETEDIQDSSVTSSKIEDGTIVNADISASAAIDATKIAPNFGSQNIVTTGTGATGNLGVTGNITVSGTVDGRDVAADGTKLDGIESGATGDQTAAEIRTLVESATDSNVFTDADHTKLNGIETAATADQTAAEIRTLVENATDSNVFTDADHTKLNGIATGAEVNVNADWNSSSGDSQILNKPTVPANINDLSDVNTTGVADGKILKYDSSTSKFIIADDTGGGGGSSTFVGLSDTPVAFSGSAGKTVKVNAAGNALEFVTVSGSDVVNDTSPQLGGNLDVQANEINTSTTNGNIKVTPNGTGLFEIKGNTNAGTLQLNCENNSHGVKIKSPPHSAAASYTLTLPNDDGSANQVLKTDGSGNLSWVNQTTDTNTQLSNAQVRTAVEAASDSNVFTDADHTKLNGIAASANNYVHPNHSGEVTSTADGATVISDDVVDEANLKVSNSPTNGQFLSAQSGNTGGLTWATVDLTALSASNLTSGTIPDARFPATLPAVSGANLTNLTPSDNTISAAKLTSDAVTNVKILDDTISEAKLDIHAAPSGTDKVLGYTANGMEWVTSGDTGKILQVVSTTKTDTSSMTGETPTDIAGFTVTITPSSTSSKIMIFACINHGGTAGGYPGFNLLRGSTEICVGTYGSASNRQLTTGSNNYDQYKLNSSILHFLDSPNTTSAVTYKVQMSTYGSQTVWINRPLSTTTSYNYTMGGTSTITAQEVAA